MTVRFSLFPRPSQGPIARRVFDGVCVGLLKRLGFATLMLWITAFAASAAGREDVEAFLRTTGFDVALESIAESAESAPAILGVDPGDFGAQWTRLSQQVFDIDDMHEMALDILEVTLSDAALAHARDFYATEFGQRLVLVENDAHVTDDDIKRQEGGLIVAELDLRGEARLDLLRQMNETIGGIDAGVRALQEIQFRTLTAAGAAGVIDLRLDPEELRAFLILNSDKMRERLALAALTGAAYTYQSFSDDEIRTYTKALEAPLMQEVYALLNAVQYEIMANRFELLAVKMADLQPGQDL